MATVRVLQGFYGAANELGLGTMSRRYSERSRARRSLPNQAHADEFHLTLRPADLLLLNDTCASRMSRQKSLGERIRRIHFRRVSHSHRGVTRQTDDRAECFDGGKGNMKGGETVDRHS